MVKAGVLLDGVWGASEECGAGSDQESMRLDQL